MISTAGPQNNGENGFTYIMLLAVVAIISIFMDVAVTMTSRAVQSAKEQELLFRGLAYRQAIASYYRASQGYQRYPRMLEDLLKDPRFPNRRHLRRLYSDPVSESHQWRLLRATDGGIAGVCSSSEDEPLKKADFPAGLENLEGVESYREWCFEYVPGKR